MQLKAYLEFSSSIECFEAIDGILTMNMWSNAVPLLWNYMIQLMKFVSGEKISINKRKISISSRWITE